MSSCRRLGWAVVASVLVAPWVCAPVRADDGGGLVGWVESTRGAPVARGRRLHLRQGHPGRQPHHPGRQPGAVRAPLAPGGLLHAAGHRQRPPALGRAAGHRAAEPRRAVHPQPRPGRREAGGRRGRGDARRGPLGEPARVALARAPQAPLRARGGRPRRGLGGRCRRLARGEGRSGLGRPRSPGRQHGARGDHGHAVARRPQRAGPPGRARVAAPRGPAGRRSPVEPRRPRRGERGADLAHGSRVPARAGRRPRGRGRRGLRRRRDRPRAFRRGARAAEPHPRGRVRARPLVDSATA